MPLGRRPRQRRQVTPAAATDAGGVIEALLRLSTGSELGLIYASRFRPGQGVTQHL